MAVESVKGERTKPLREWLVHLFRLLDKLSREGIFTGFFSYWVKRALFHYKCSVPSLLPQPTALSNTLLSSCFPINYIRTFLLQKKKISIANACPQWIICDGHNIIALSRGILQNLRLHLGIAQINTLNMDRLQKMQSTSF